MYIKQLIIQGFKSYKDQTVMEPFSPGVNVIVGRNGSGKSNFFAAIRFVLGDAYTQLSREERQSLLHEGSGSAVMSAYVEIIFDNSDGRFTDRGKEVSLRRTIGLKRDEYSVDKKVMTRSDINSMLDTAGFSLKNSYYIVPQGRVTALTNMKESDRLKLLKEVAGTESYENRRAESLKIMAETNSKRGKIDELLDYIKSRMSELEEEKEELRGFQEKDRERRCLEYAYYNQQQMAFQEALAEIEDSRQGASDSENQKLFMDGEKALSKMEHTLQELQQSLELLSLERQQLEDDRRETARARAKAELKVKSLADSQSARDQARQQHDAELAAVRAEIADKENQLRQLEPEYQVRRERELKIKQAFDLAEAGRLRLLNKQTRGSQFKNKAQRDEWLGREIEDINMNLSGQKANLMSAEEDVTELSKLIQSLEAEISMLRQSLEGYGGDRGALRDQVSEAQDRLEKLQEERKVLRREDDKLDSISSNARQERDRAERDMSRNAMDHQTARGLATIRRLKQERDIPGAYGTLAELMDVPENFRVPVEQVAGGSLFHYVVDNADTGTMLAKELNKLQGGRITFMPLAQLRTRHVNLPRANDAIPVVSKINYDPLYEKAFQHVFGRTIICPNLMIASQYASRHNIDAITLEGDTANKRGAMTGGYIDPRKSKLEAVRTVNKWREEYERLHSQAEDIRTQIGIKDQEITHAMGEVRKLEQQLRQVDDGFEPLRAEHRNKSAQLERERDRLDEAIRRRDSINDTMERYSSILGSLETERNNDFKKALSAQEEEQLQSFSKQVQDLQKQFNDANARRSEIEGRKRVIEVDLRQNLRLKEDQLTSQVFETSSSAGGDDSYSDAQKELKKIQKRTDSISQKLRKVEAEIEKQNTQISSLLSRKADKEQEQQELARAVEKQKKRMEKGLQRKALLTQQLAETAKNIRDLGVLPDEAFDKYQNMDAAKISKKLKTVNESLKKFKHVNKKAFEQYNNFTTQQEQLLKRRKELDSSQSSIEELVAHLDRVKDESIERTFKQISKEFARIFERLVPAGKGRLVIQRRHDRRGADPVDDEEERGGSVENYYGVGISVSFNSKEYDEQQKVQQLSGGQKSLCALCLIFAIQQTDPSPMVVFDEVDANLDAQYRTAVAGLLESISEEAGTQFICTTFRPEIVHVADKCYGVTFTNKTSSIDCVPTEAALSFVEGQKR
ncbi:uncharacterized protein E0L32_005552 [Thyridium curvatum]|uniref:Structural maintenance of chromosomes protein n=1 Tax=Thyridium curvatum TaxID=1093900 RepID=A0A507B5I5_9PEZI|nr:uncharacterized protein E0L32_005552 [Thyridium curvatum]TPX14356.1 hypothetical protein E0L32_005552 [Thyridium curvatum]